MFPYGAFVLAVLLFCACRGSEQIPAFEEDSFSIEFTEKSVSNKATEFSMEVTANCDWSFSLDANWAYIIEPRTFYNGSRTLVIGVLKNESTSERTATFEFKYSKGTKTLKVTQTAFDVSLSVSDQDVVFGYRNAEKIIKVTSNCGWEANSSQEWLAVRPITGLVGSFEITLEVETNNETDGRTAQVTIWNEKYCLSQIITVTQHGSNNIAVKDYVDEYGVNHGEGIVIGQLEWAPVNCGFQEKEYPYGKIYQWGRKQGVGYRNSEMGDPGTAVIAETWRGKNGSEDPEAFYIYGDGSKFNYDWLLEGDNSFWNQGTEQNPIKNEMYDPCPKGWRVPTAYEFRKLLQSTTCQWSTWNNTVNGLELTGKTAPDASQTLFLPAGGRINAFDGLSYDRNIEGYYWTMTAVEGSSAFLYFFEGGESVNPHGSRAGGCSLRCIKE